MIHKNCISCLYKLKNKLGQMDPNAGGQFSGPTFCFTLLFIYMYIIYHFLSNQIIKYFKYLYLYIKEIYL
jgi:hypothetical protein